MKTSPLIKQVLEEKLASIEHERWAHWQKYLHTTCTPNPDGSLTIPAELVERWNRQINTPYTLLSEKEKQSDRDQVARYLPLIESKLQEVETETAELWKRRVEFLLFEEGSFTPKEVKTIVSNLQNGMVDQIINRDKQ